MKRNENLNRFIASFVLGSFIFCGSYGINKINKKKELTNKTFEEIISVDNNKTNNEIIIEDNNTTTEEEIIDNNTTPEEEIIDNNTASEEEIIDNSIIFEEQVTEDSTLLEENNNIITCNYGYLLNDMMLYDNLENMNEIAYIDKYQKIVIISLEGEYSLINYIDDYENIYTGYVYTSGLEILPNTFIEIDIELQEIRLFMNNELAISSSVITGKDESPTYIGYYYIDLMESPSVLRRYYPDGTLEYENPVNYWMAFNGGIGIHDASWRSESDYNNKELYHEYGSHGCVNTPYDTVEFIYNNVNEGTKVLVHK